MICFIASSQNQIYCKIVLADSMCGKERITALVEITLKQGIYKNELHRHLNIENKMQGSILSM